MDVKPISVSVPNAVKMTGFGRSTLYELMKTGKLTRRKQGSRTLLLVSELEAYVNALPAETGEVN